MSSVHSEELVLLSYMDGELDAARAAEVRQHLAACEACRAFVSEAQDALRVHNAALRDDLPPPPRPWVDLRPRFNDLDAERLQTRRPWPFQPVWWAAAAAGIAAVLMVIRLSTSETVSAAELLAKASENEVAPARVQVKSRKGRFVRVSREVGDSELAAMFRDANFDWNDPLRAGAFADWRNGLAEKQDEVRVLESPASRSGRFYRITTSTPQGGLREVSIMIRAADLRAVEERFQFRNREWVEISEAPSDFPRTRPIPADQQVAEASAPSAEVSASDEIRTLEALHRIGADLGEPVEVRRSERSVDVIVLGASARREKEIRNAVGGLPHVALRFEQPQAVRGSSVESGQADGEAPSGPLHSRLLRLMGSAAHVESFTNAALEESESILARAHAVRQLTDRFASTGSLNVEDRDAIQAIAADHRRVLRESVGRLGDVLHPLLGTVDSPGGSLSVDARSLLGSAQRLDTLLTLALASPKENTDADEIVGRIRRALGELQRAAAEYTP